MDKKIIVLGGTGLVGKALQRIMPNAKYFGSSHYDLTRQMSVERMFLETNPDIVINLSAVVSGIEDNILRPCDHFTENVLMNTFVIDACRKHNVSRCISILSTCAYPDVAKSYPLLESQIFEDVPTKTNFSYGYAKRMAAVQTLATNEQYGTKYSYLIPSNIFGIDDKYQDARSHYIGALIKKIYNAKKTNQDSITLFGTGKPIRQFIFCEDVAKIIKHFIDNDVTENVNIANDDIFTIDEIARIALKACDMEHLQINYDSTKPDGQFRKDCSNQKLKDIMPDLIFTSLYDGIKKTFIHYEKNN